MAELAARIAVVDPARYPNVARVGDDLLSGDGGSRSAWAFDVLLDGILAVRSPSA